MLWPMTGTAKARRLLVSEGVDVVHRIIEHQAALDGHRVAVVDTGETITYSLLNARANVLARALRCAGLRRGGHALIAGEASIDVVVALLSVLKSGASYTWSSATDTRAGNPVISVAPQVGRTPDEYLPVTPVLEHGLLHSSPNLPVLSRGPDVACVVSPFDETSRPLSHAAIVARRGTGETWLKAHDDRTAVPLWVALMDGLPVTLPGRAAAAA